MLLRWNDLHIAAPFRTPGCKSPRANEVLASIGYKKIHHFSRPDWACFTTIDWRLRGLLLLSPTAVIAYERRIADTEYNSSRPARTVTRHLSTFAYGCVRIPSCEWIPLLCCCVNSCASPANHTDNIDKNRRLHVERHCHCHEDR